MRISGLFQGNIPPLVSREFVELITAQRIKGRHVPLV